MSSMYHLVAKRLQHLLLKMLLLPELKMLFKRQIIDLYLLTKPLSELIE
ncbi:hypothetical protein [Gilliamella sp. M0320]|nr:hypothetical protein [Gilliamella sp. M0320]